MPPHAYIDESGTMDRQGVMSIAMVILEGANSAQRLHDQVMKALDPKYLDLIRQLKKERKAANFWPQLHFADMSSDQKRIVGKRLAQAKVTVFTAHHVHDGDKVHSQRFGIYTELIKTCVLCALEQYDEIKIHIGKQGGWQNYEQNFCAELRELPEQFIQSGKFRKATFELLSATKPGIQLADFYAGAVRDFVMDEASLMPFDFVREQVLSRDIYCLEPVESER